MVDVTVKLCLSLLAEYSQQNSRIAEYWNSIMNTCEP